MNDIRTAHPFSNIRTTIETDVKAPGVIAVSSAIANDGKTGVCAGLVRSLAAAGYRTLAIDAADSDGALSERLGLKKSAPLTLAAANAQVEASGSREPGADFITLQLNDEMPSAIAIAALYAAVRKHYDYAVVDTRSIGDGGLAFARNADGVVLALREGRSIATEDRDTVDVLNRLNVRFLGVIATKDQSVEPHAATESKAPLSIRARFQQLFAFKSSL